MPNIASAAWSRCDVVAGGEAEVDQPPQPLPERQHQPGRDQQGGQRLRECAGGTRPQIGDHQPERADAKAWAGRRNREGQGLCS